MTVFELAVQDTAGIAVAQRIRPDRIELASALSTGGTTPSTGLVELAVASGTPVHVLVRPRLGDFEYDSADRELLLADARHVLELGVAGIVIGGTRTGAVDRDLMTAVLELAAGADVTFHRAFDTLSDRAAALDALADLGVTRVLTSGGASSVGDALGEIRALVGRAAGAIQIMAGGGVDASNAAIVASTGVDAVHASAKRTVSRGSAPSLGSADPGGAASYETTDEAAALLIRDALTDRTEVAPGSPWQPSARRLAGA